MLLLDDLTRLDHLTRKIIRLWFESKSNQQRRRFSQAKDGHAYGATQSLVELYQHFLL